MTDKLITHEEAIKLLKRYGNDQENVMELYRIIENEISDLKDNYKAINEMLNNSAIYGAKIQVELNKLKKDIARYFYLENLTDDKHTIEVAIEHHALKEKLSKVGKEWN